VPLDPPLGEGAHQYLGCLRRGRDRTPEVDHQRDFRPAAKTSIEQVLVQQQRGLARRGRAFVWRRQHPDHHPTALELGERIVSLQRSIHRVELVPALEQSGRRRRIEISTERDDHDLALGRSGVRLHPPGIGIDRADRGLHEPNPRLDDVTVEMAHALGHRPPEHIISSLEKPNTNASL
jgi:hypothetical protein